MFLLLLVFNWFVQPTHTTVRVLNCLIQSTVPAVAILIPLICNGYARKEVASTIYMYRVTVLILLTSSVMSVECDNNTTRLEDNFPYVATIFSLILTKRDSLSHWGTCKLDITSIVYYFVSNEKVVTPYGNFSQLPSSVTVSL